MFRKYSEIFKNIFGNTLKCSENVQKQPKYLQKYLENVQKNVQKMFRKMFSFQKNGHSI
jgi:hypothetical protein